MSFCKIRDIKEQAGLVYPTPAMIMFVDRLETLFCSIFKGLLTCHMY